MSKIVAALLWTVVWHGHGDTVLQYNSEQECRAAIVAGLPYTQVPPNNELSCQLRADNDPVQVCSDGENAHVASGENCKNCLTRDNRRVTSVLCEGHGYAPVTKADSDDYGFAPRDLPQPRTP